MRILSPRPTYPHLAGTSLYFPNVDEVVAITEYEYQTIDGIEFRQASIYNAANELLRITAWIINNAPTITNVVPTQIDADGITTVVIDGTNFGTDINTVRISLMLGVEPKVAVITACIDNQITARFDFTSGWKHSPLYSTRGNIPLVVDILSHNMGADNYNMTFDQFFKVS